MTFDDFLRRTWRERSLITYALWPISLAYSSLVEARRIGYSTGLFAVEKFTHPIIVIGNLTVGGTGKTPLTIWAVNCLRDAGYSPGVISRGYGRRNSRRTRMVNGTSTAREVGDEPLLIWRHSGAPVAVAERRADAVRMLLREANCDIFVSDDGLQHLAIDSDLKVVLIDGEERFGNGYCLPAGPLREHSGRVHSFDLKIVNGIATADEYAMDCQFTEAVNLLDPTKRMPLSDFVDQKVTAIAGIRHPHKFFNMLADAGIHSDNHSFADHYDYVPSDFESILDLDGPLLMTEKDAVKCMQFAAANWWYVGIEAVPGADFKAAFADKVSAIASPRL